MLGYQVLQHLRMRAKAKKESLYGADVIGWSHKTERGPDGFEFAAFDLAEYDSGGWPDYRRALWGQSFDLMVHCAALTDADYCEQFPGEAWAYNAQIPEWLAKFAREKSARFVYISTDAVYDDSKPGRRKEDEQPNPKSVYAKTKLEGEGRVLAAYPEALVVRTTMFGWTLKTASRPKFAEQILAALTARKQIQLFGDAYFSPLHVDMLAEILLDLAELDISGVLNVGARNPISKLAFGQEIAWHFGLDDSFIEEGSVDDLELPAKRTKNVGLDVSAFTRLMGPPPSVDQGITQLYQETFNGTAKKLRGRETYP